jgi:hypothetical protein
MAMNMKKKKPSPETSRVTPSINRSVPSGAPEVKHAASVPAKKAAAPKRVAVVDYPLEGEIVKSPHYTLRIGASETDAVEVSIDGKEWQACRPNVGYWWYDWSGYSAGGHSIVARVKSSAARYSKSKLRHFTVLI